MPSWSCLIALALAGLFWGPGDWSHFRRGKLAGDEGVAGAGNRADLRGLRLLGLERGDLSGRGDPRAPRAACRGRRSRAASTVLALYVLINVVYVFALDPADDDPARPPSEVEPVAELATVALFGERRRRAESRSCWGWGCVASVAAYLLAGPRVAVAMARTEVFPAIEGGCIPGVRRRSMRR